MKPKEPLIKSSMSRVADKIAMIARRVTKVAAATRYCAAAACGSSRLPPLPHRRYTHRVRAAHEGDQPFAASCALHPIPQNRVRGHVGLNQRFPKVFIFVGHSGSGKTTLIEQLVREFSTRGLRVATIKHAHHRVVLDTPGKDSWRHKQAGAVISMLVTSDQLQLVADAPVDRTGRREPEQLARRFLGEADLVLAEGFSHAAGAKIEVLRRECTGVPRCAAGDGLIALVTDVAEAHPQLPHFALGDICGVADFMLQRGMPDHEHD